MSSCIGGGVFRPLIRNISAVVFGANSIEYKPIWGHLGYRITQNAIQH